VNTNTLLIGIDISLKNNHVVVLDSSKKKLASFSVTNDLPGARLLKEKLLQFASSHDTTHIKIGMEATSLYWWHLYQFLVQDEILGKFSLEVYTLNPKLVKRFHDSLSELDKTDPIDAEVIAEYIGLGKVKLSHVIDDVYEPLKRLTRFRYHLVKNLITEKNYFLLHLFLKYSAWQQLDPFSNDFGATAHEFISEYDAEELLLKPIADLTVRITDLSRGRVIDPDKTAKLLHTIAQNSYQLKKTYKEPIDLILANTYDNIKYFEGKIKTLDTVIEKEYGRFPDTLRTIPGIGLVFAAGIMSEVGNPTRFSKQSAIGKFAGLAWKKSQSSEFDAEETPRKPGNTYLRYYLVQAASSLHVHNEEYKQYYERKYQESHKHRHKRALVLTARKLARLCFAMLRDQRLYNSTGQRKE